MRLIEILLVEDSPTDRLIAVEALGQARLRNSLNVVENGVEAMAYLRREGKYSAALRPDIILLDLNLPKKDGREVLAEIKADPLLKYIPVVVLTTSKADEDIVRAYGNYANSYITKPVDFERFSAALRALEGYWFEIVTLPQEQAIQRLSPAVAALPTPTVARTGPAQVVRVLIAEDNPTDFLLIKDALADTPLVRFEVNHVLRLAELRKRIAEGNIDVVVTDLGLPDSQGLETFRQIRSCASGLPIIVLTGLSDEAVGIAALREGAQEYLVKGQISESALVRVLRYAIEKKEVEERLRRSQRMEAIGQLTAGIAHDFNNILTVIRGRAEIMLMQQANTSDPFRTSAKEICDASIRAANLTRQLLTFSRQQAMEMRGHEFNTIIGDIAKMLRRILGEETVLELQLCSSPLFIHADQGMLEQVIVNLTVNARDAMPGGGKLSLETSSVVITPEMAREGHPDGYAGHFAKLRVSDTGCGIPSEIINRIFDPFFTTKDVGKGTGLGLSTVMGIVQQHRGWVEVKSRVGEGTSFFVHIPLADSEASSKETGGVVAATPRSGTETILLVEDDESVRTLAKMVLEMNGYRVLEASSGVDALNIWAQRGDSVQLLLTDMVMPDGKSGRELADELLGLKPSLKVIYSSGYSREFKSEGFELRKGVNFLPKPYQMAELLDTVRRALDQRT